ncbi:hypothetical protein [Nocardioides ferulae]|uniref:hypothetical protein n=1 Tax=Nocardioides ferulae TaxID=2340821 RepID=UPI0013DE66E6|nr:hypothetical protein [Nocardioides ferulae]
MFGCDREPDPEKAADEVAAARSAVQESLRSVVAIAEDAGVRVPQAGGEWSTCGVNPTRMEYAAGGTAEPTDRPVAEVIESLTVALEDDGWEVENAGTGPEPYAVLTRDGLRASLGLSRRVDTRGQLSLGVVSDCVHTTREQDQLLGEKDAVI